jgi:hypothetical protein
MAGKKTCEIEHKDLCSICNKPSEERCAVHLLCRCNRNSKELIVGHRFETALFDGASAFMAASLNTTLAREMPISGPVWRYKDKGKWIVQCYGCMEFKSSSIEHDWLIKWAYKHRCEARMDMPN